MKINDKNGLLKPEEVNQAFDDLLEELDQTANGPELDQAAGELKDEATEDKKPEAAPEEMENKDVYCDACHEQKEDVEGVVVKEEDSQTANGPSLEQPAAELKDEATEGKEPEAAPAEIENKDVYSNEVHDEKEDVEASVVKEDAISEDELEQDNVAADAEEEFGEVSIDAERVPEAEADNNAAEDTVADIDALTEEDESDKEEKELEAEEEDDDKKEDAEDEEKYKEKDEDSDEKDEEEKESTIDESMNALFNLLRTINEEASQLSNGPELDQAASELKDEATETKEAEAAPAEVENKDVYSNEVHDEKEDVEGVVVKEEDSQTANGPSLEQPAAELKDEATEGKEPETKALDITNTDVYCDMCHDEKEDVDGVVVESEQTANGPELDQAASELKDEATETKEAEAAPAEVENKDVYSADVHKQVEDVVGVIVEAAARCRANGKKATMANITEAVVAMFESDEADPKAVMGVGKEFADKEYDVDAAIESKEMNGGSEEKYEEIQGEGAKAALTAEIPAGAVQESVQYTSLKEACMLDEGYFETDSYNKETAEAKVKKLTEQLSLLIARESADPLYDELLKESIYCQRLQEQCKAKYGAQAAAKVKKIINKK